jgi:hypothetical protein
MTHWDQMDEAEARAMYTEWSKRMAEAKQRLRATADDFTTARKLSDRAGLVLRDRFGIDPKTGRKVRKVRNLLDLTG